MIVNNVVDPNSDGSDNVSGGDGGGGDDYNADDEVVRC